MKVLIAIILLTTSIISNAQPNCSIFEGECKVACELYIKSETFNQGTYRAHELFDSAIMYCPAFSYAHHEKSVGYLKNGEFLLWRKHMDEAVRLNPKNYLSNRGWCRFKFLHDYEGAISDLTESKKVNNGFLGWSGDGDYDLELMIALCHRELGHADTALRLMDRYFFRKETNKNDLGVGSYDYLHYGVTQLRVGKSDEAMSSFVKQINVYKQLPDTYYYIALIYDQRGNHEKYLENLNLAYDFIVKGYSRKDPYCEALDEVYLSDVTAALGKSH